MSRFIICVMTIVARRHTARGDYVLRQAEVDDEPAILEIFVDGVSLMSSANGISEKSLADLCIDPLLDGRSLRVLIGGLGMGFTLAAALRYKQVTAVDVIEQEPLIVDWARNHFASLNGNALSDPRVRVVVGDFLSYITLCPTGCDVVLIDVDNGPTWLVQDSNGELYEAPALKRLRTLLAPRGVLGVWSSERAPDFEVRLGETFGDHAIDTFVVKELINSRKFEFFIYRARS